MLEGMSKIAEEGTVAREGGVGVRGRGVGVPGRKGLEYVGEGGWSTWERLEYLGEGGWSTWEGGRGIEHVSQFTKCIK